jgi:hypothetical protein
VLFRELDQGFELVVVSDNARGEGIHHAHEAVQVIGNAVELLFNGHNPSVLEPPHCTYFGAFPCPHGSYSAAKRTLSLTDGCEYSQNSMNGLGDGSASPISPMI